jgi:hypothetical protein
LYKDYESWVSNKQDNVSGFGDPIGDDDHDTTNKILFFSAGPFKGVSWVVWIYE